MVMMVEKSMELLLLLSEKQQGISSSTTTAVRLEDVPDEILVEIFLRLPSESVHCLQSVSEKLYKMVGNRLFSNLHMFSAAAAAAEVPRLIITIQSECRDPGGVKGRPLTLQLMKYDPVSVSLLEGGNVTVSHSNNNNSVNIFSWSSLQVRCVFRNLFCFASTDHHHPHTCFLFNPLPLGGRKGGEVAILPSAPLHSSPFAWYGMGMGFDAKTNTFKIKVVGANLEDQEGYVAYIYELGTSTSWRRIPSAPPTSLDPSMGVSAFGNMFYWWKAVIISFDFNREEFGSTPRPDLKGPARRGLIHLLTLRGSLAVAHINTSSNHVDIWVLSDPNKDWTLDYKIPMDACLTSPACGQLRNGCGEWEHGLFFIAYHHQSGQWTSNAIFLDLRCGGSIRRVLFPEEFQGVRQRYTYSGRLFSFTESTISLKHYANLLEAKEDGEWCIAETKPEC